MTALTISTVTSWDPAALTTKAREFGTAAGAVDRESSRLTSAMDTAAGTWSGAAADAAAGRISREAAAGRDLAAALQTARRALDSGASRIGGARSTLLGLVQDARATGFTVGDDGAVTPPTLPPVMTTPGDTSAAEERDRRQRALDDAARTRAEGIGQALGAVMSADATTAGELLAAEVPASLAGDTASLLERLRNGRETLESVIPGGAGVIALGHSLQKAWALFGRTRSFVSFLTSTAGRLTSVPGALAFLTGRSADATAFARFALLGRRADAAMRTFQFGKPPGALLSRLPGAANVMRHAGKVFLPLTVLSGLSDVATGGGYDGARGVTTRVLGAAGATGAGALLASSFVAGAALGPVGLAVASAAVLAYGAWSLGNLIYDNWGAITDAVGRAANWVGDRAVDAGRAVVGAATWTADRVGDAAAWAGDRLTDAGRAVRDGLGAVAEGGKRLVDGALNILSFGF